MEDYESCIVWAQSSLEFSKNNFKGYLRMINSYIKLKNADKSRTSLNKLKNLQIKSLDSEIKSLNKQIENLEKNQINLHKNIMKKTAQKMNNSLSFCECNICLANDFKNRVFKHLQKDKIVLEKYKEDFLIFKNNYSELLNTEKGKKISN